MAATTIQKAYFWCRGSLRFLCFTAGNRGPLNVTIVQVGKGNGGGGDGGSDLLRLEPPSDLRPTPSPLSDTSATLQSDNNDTFSGGEAIHDYSFPLFQPLMHSSLVPDLCFTLATWIASDPQYQTLSQSCAVNCFTE